MDTEKSRMRLSLDLSAVDEQAQQDPSVSLESYQVIDSAVVCSKSPDGIQVEFKLGGSNIRGFVHQGHLSDYTLDVNQALLDTLSVGSQLKNLVVVNSSKSGMPQLSIKKTQRDIAHANRHLKLSDLNGEALYTGFVSSVMEFGVFVQFERGLLTLCPKANLCDEYVSKCADFFVKSQTVRVRVTAVDLEQERVTGSLKSSVVGMIDTDYVRGVLTERRTLFKARAPLHADILTVEKGQAVKGIVTNRVEGLGVEVALLGMKDVLGFCMLEHCPEKSLPRVGSELAFRVLDVDLSKKGIIDLSSRKSLEHSRWVNDSDTTIKHTCFDADVELGKREYAIVSFECNGVRLMARVATCSSNTAVHATPLRIGMTCKVQCASDIQMLELVSSVVTHRNSTRPRARSCSLTESFGQKSSIEVGAIVEARITAVKGCWMTLETRNLKSEPIRAMIHSTDIADHPESVQYGLYDKFDDVFSHYSIGDVVQAKVVEIQEKACVLTMRPSLMKASQPVQAPVNWDTRLPQLNQVYNGWVDQVIEEGVFVGLTRKLRGFVFCTEVSDNVSDLEFLFNEGNIRKVFPVGRPVRVKVKTVNTDAKKLALQMVWGPPSESDPAKST